MIIFYVVIRRLPSRWGISTLLYLAAVETLIEAFAISAVVRLVQAGLLHFGAGSLTEARLRYALDNVAQVAFTSGHDFALSNLGAMGGRATSDKKHKSSVANGKKGGRPRKQK